MTVSVDQTTDQARYTGDSIQDNAYNTLNKSIFTNRVDLYDLDIKIDQALLPQLIEATASNNCSKNCSGTCTCHEWCAPSASPCR